jgi:hypothetical protein
VKKPSWADFRDGVLFFVGVAGVIFEMVFRRPPDYGMLPVLAGFAGLPAFIRRDQHDDKKEEDGSPTARSDNALPGG